MKFILIGVNGLLYIFYLVGERMLYVDFFIWGSLIGMDGVYKREYFLRVIMEGIIFFLYELIELFCEVGKLVYIVVFIGGGVKNEMWL